jgi:CubicO group peptidase (beta-lactamase class C family)
MENSGLPRAGCPEQLGLSSARSSRSGSPGRSAWPTPALPRPDRAPRAAPQIDKASGALAPVPERGYGFGLGFAVRRETGRSPVPGAVGEYFWGGVTGTCFWIDPAERLIAVLMLQAPEQRLHYRYLTRALVYAALTGPVPG